MRNRYSRVVVVASFGVGLSCTGTIADSPATHGDPIHPGPNDPGPAPPEVDVGGLPGPALAASSRMRRLTVDEYNRTVLDLLGDPVKAGQSLQDTRNPFDNDYGAQVVSDSLITGTELLAKDIVGRLLADTARRDRIVGCRPASVMDTSCLRQFVTRFGRLAWRRTLTNEEITRLMTLHSLAQQNNDFYAAVDAVMKAALQDPEFVFRIEVGTEVSPGLFKLSGPEMATRLSYFLWGSTPDLALLDLAERMGGLDTSDGVRKAAGEMLTRRAAPVLARIARFHAMWMGYEQLPSSPLAPAMKRETDSLISRVIFEKGLPWQDLLRSKETYVTYDLAKSYGIVSLPPTLKPGLSVAAWVPYADSKRQGLLSHASFLQLGVRNGETHPVLRGKGIRELLFCQELKVPTDVDTSKPATTTTSPCKRDKAAAHAAGSCAGCHAQLDPVGFGLENYDAQGKYRLYDKDPITQKDLTQCPISGKGALDKQEFNGPAELANLMLGSDPLNACVVTQLYRFAMGTCGATTATCHSPLDAIDEQFIQVMAKRIGASDFRFDQLLLDFVSSGAFAHRRAGI